MAIERFINSHQTTLNGAINDSVTSITVAAGTSVAAQFRAIIDNEIVIVTAGGNTTTWTVTRGAEGTSAASHSNGSQVTVIQTQGSFEQLIKDQCRSGTYANLPATSDALEGHIYLPTDSIYDKLRFNGSDWVRFRNGLEVPEIPTTGWSLTYGTATDTAPFTPTIEKGFIKLVLAASSGNFIHLYRRDVPSDPTVTPYFVEIGIRISGGVIIAGVAFFDDTGGDDGTILTVNRTGGSYSVFTSVYDLPTATQLTNLATTNSIFGGELYFGLEEDGTNRKTYFGSSPHNLQLTSTQGRTVTYTATDLAVVCYTGNAAYPVQVDLIHWKVR